MIFRRYDKLAIVCTQPRFTRMDFFCRDILNQEYAATIRALVQLKENIRREMATIRRLHEEQCSEILFLV